MEIPKETERSYIAFISYRHLDLDREAAERVQKKIENYTVPKEFRKRAGGKKLGMCFRDEDELPASSSLSESICYALDHSKFLIVICTPDLPRSKWCEAEIRYFLKTHDRDHILAVLANGTPEESFSPCMLHDYDEEGNVIADREPLAANIAGEDHTINRKAFKKEIVRIYAALLGCPFNMIWQRERRARTNRILAAGAAAIAVLAVFLGVVVNRNAKIEEQNTKIAEQNTELEQQNQEISNQNNEIRGRVSTVLVESANEQMRIHDVSGAIVNGIEALESNDPEIYDHGAAAVLSNAVCAYKKDEIQSSIVYEQPLEIRRISVTDDQNEAVFTDVNGTVRCMDLHTYEILWQTDTGDRFAELYTKNQEDRILIKSCYGLFCLSVKDGSEIWSFRHEDMQENYFQCISGDGSVFAAAELSDDEGNFLRKKAALVFLRTRDGQEIGRTDLTREDVNFRMDEGIARPYDYAASFSGDGKTFACILPVEPPEDNTDVLKLQEECIFQVDLNTFACSDIGTVHEELSPLYCIETDPEDGSLFYAGYDERGGGIYTALCHENADDANILISKHDWRDSVGFPANERYAEIGSYALSRNDTVILFSDNEMLIFDRKENRLRRGRLLNDTITDGYWIDREAGIFEIATADGDFQRFELGGETLFARALEYNIDLNRVKHIVQLNGGILDDPKNGAILSIEGNRILITRCVSDPDRVDISLADQNIGYVNKVLYPPDSDYVFVFHDSHSVTRVDKNTGEVNGSASYEDSVGLYDPVIPDDDHFLIGDTLYDLEGNAETAEAVAEEGYVSVREPDKDKVQTLEKQYASGEISAVGFSEQGELILIVCGTGRLDLYETKDLSPVFSEEIPELNELVSIAGPELSQIADKISGRYSADRSQFLVFLEGAFPTAVFIDAEKWSYITAVQNVYTYDSRYDMIYGYRGLDLFSCPLHSLHDLRQMAEDYLGKKENEE